MSLCFILCSVNVAQPTGGNASVLGLQRISVACDRSESPVALSDWKASLQKSSR